MGCDGDNNVPALLEPWGGRVEGSVLDPPVRGHSEYVVLEDGATEGIALWAMHTHALDAFVISPRLAITSVVMRCGKTTLLDVLAKIVRRPLPTVNATAAAIFRVVDNLQPTILMDEADTFLAKNDELRGILNSGHRRNDAFVIRADGIYSTWAPAAVAMIGRLPGTLEDRSISVRLKRRRSDNPSLSSLIKQPN